MQEMMSIPKAGDMDSRAVETEMKDLRTCQGDWI